GRGNDIAISQCGGRLGVVMVIGLRPCGARELRDRLPGDLVGLGQGERGSLPLAVDRHISSLFYCCRYRLRPKARLCPGASAVGAGGVLGRGVCSRLWNRPRVRVRFAQFIGSTTAKLVYVIHITSAEE